MQHATWIGIGVVLCAAEMAHCQPSLSHLAPAALRPGHVNELTLHGEKLDDPLQIWTSFPAKIELLPGDGSQQPLTTRRCRITVASDTAVGIAGLIVGTAAGISDVKLLMIDDLATVVDAGDNHTVEAAQTVEFPGAVDAILDGGASNYYRFSAAAGQRISCEVVAGRLASTMDPVVRLLDRNGNELLLVDDDASYGPDPRFQFLCEESGEYLVELRDNRFRGGGSCRLRLGDFPLVSVPYPLGGRLGSTFRIQFAGPAAEGVPPTLLQMPSQLHQDSLPVAVKYTDGQSSATATLAATKLPEILEVEPNDTTTSATNVVLPCALNGRLQQEHDCDYFAFAARKGQAYAFRVVARQLGSPSVLFLRVHDLQGQQLAETQVDTAGDLTLRYRFPADGVYCLSAEDLLRRGGPSHAYRIEAELDEGFELTLKKGQAFNFALPSNGGAIRLPVQVSRRGYDGQIQLDMVASPPEAHTHLTVIDGRIPAKAKEHSVLIAIDEHTSPGTLMSFRLVGRAKVNGKDQIRTVKTRTAVLAKWQQLTAFPGWHDGLLAVVAGPEVDVPFDIKLQDDSATLDVGTKKAVWTLSLERKHKDFKGPLTIALHGLPRACSHTVQHDDEQYRVTVTGSAGGHRQNYYGELIAFGELSGQGWIVTRSIKLALHTPKESQK